jgi:hypothetical protein
MTILMPLNSHRSNTSVLWQRRGSVLLQDLLRSRTSHGLGVLPSFQYEIRSATRIAEHTPMGPTMRLHLISSAVLLYTLLTLVAICLAELGSTPQNMPF